MLRSLFLRLSASAWCLLPGPAPLAEASAAPAKTALPASYSRHVRPILETYCYECHGHGKKKGSLALDRYTGEEVLTDRRTWIAVLDQMGSRLMPPHDEAQPTEAERQRLLRWIDHEVLDCDSRHWDPGQVTLRRLNRAEYNRTVHDLLGVEARPADDFPADDTGYGFDNIGDVLSMPPVLLEKYLQAAEALVEQAWPAVTGDTAPVELARAGHPALLGSLPFADTEEAVRRILQRFATRAFRRPVAAEDLDRLMTLHRDSRRAGENLQGALKVAFKAVLVSPQFLFRGEGAKPDERSSGNIPLDDYALAARLSYFLWSTMPDEQLFALAEKGRLRRQLAAETKRMLQDGRAQALVERFASQWLQLPKLAEMEPDPKRFPSFDVKMREAMQRETELFLGTVMREDRSVLEFLDADYTFVNQRLAAHYGLAAPSGHPFQGEAFQKVSLAGTTRGGLLTQASILTLTSNPTRTSPVKRGKWVLENILGAPPPPPPANVPELSEVKLKGSLRQRLEQHRDNPMCASCHARMDPLGFGFENFDAVGAWREKDDGFPVEPAGQLQSGESFQTPAELRQILVRTKRQEFLRCLTGKLLTYALGRGLEFQDRCTVDQIVERLEREQDRFSALVLGIVESVPFRFRRGGGSEGADGH